MLPNSSHDRRKTETPTIGDHPTRSTRTRKNPLTRGFADSADPVLTVDLLRSYLNRGDLLHDLGETTRQLAKACERSELPVARSVSTVAPGFRQRRLADRLDNAQVQAIVSAFEAGTPRWQLAMQHGISVSSVGRLLRRRRQGLGAA
jgi:hypothetical protein